MAFYQGDINGDEVLDFAEFCSIAPKAMRDSLSPEEMKALFDSVDLDKNGNVTLDEFFIWTLSFVQESTGTGLAMLLRTYVRPWPARA